MHAEATSEKLFSRMYLDGRVTAFVGTHTHVPTADERVFRLELLHHRCSMTGPYDSVIGVQKELIIARFLNNMPVRFEAATGDVRLCAVVVDAMRQRTRPDDRKIDFELTLQVSGAFPALSGCATAGSESRRGLTPDIHLLLGNFFFNLLHVPADHLGIAPHNRPLKAPAGPSFA